MSPQRPHSRTAADVLPLTHLAFHVLLALADEPSHGYAIVRDVRERSGGKVDPGTGSFYSVIHGLSRSGLIEAVDGPSDPSLERRRYYRITTFGRAVLAAETDRLRRLIQDADRHGARRRSAKAGAR
jgi:DNA-binding PadR family transcriptional regulator